MTKTKRVTKKAQRKTPSKTKKQGYTPIVLEKCLGHSLVVKRDGSLGVRFVGLRNYCPESCYPFWNQ